MLAVLNRRWLANGWRVMDPADSETMALVWIELLDRDRIPYQHYDELFRRAVDLRARRLENGLKCDDFSAEMMIACWPPLAAELHKRDIRSGRFLTPNAESDCPRCYGTGVERIIDADGKAWAKPGCDHD